MFTALVASLLVLLVVVATFAMLVVGLEGHLAARMPRLAHRARAAALLLNGDVDELEAMQPLASRRPRRAQRAGIARLAGMLHRATPEGQPSH